MAYLALDLGAGSGRAIVGRIKDGKLEMEEILRFDNQPVKLGDTIYWDFPALFSNVKKGIALAVKKGYKLRGIGVDTWGVDFGMIDTQGRLLSNPVTYRDRRTEGQSNVVLKLTTREDLYDITGIQLMEINTLFQVFKLSSDRDPAYEISDKILFTPDLINYFLTGEVANEYTIASTSQMMNATTKDWSKRIFDWMGFERKVMGNIVMPGKVIGELTDEVALETGAKAKVFSVGSHDTASAIGAIPESGGNWAFLSCGTWSLLGMPMDAAILTPEAMNDEFTNEGGVNGKILFMRNITGLWLLQRLIAEWEAEDGEKQSYDSLLAEAAISEEFRTIVNSDDAAFGNPDNMAQAIRDYAERTGQPVPESKGQFVRCVVESLAVKYHFVMKNLQKYSDKKIEKLHIVGGGSQNALLNQFTANVLGIDVVVGLTEATAIGNIMQQAIADKKIKNWDAAHEIIRDSFEFKTYKPADTAKWVKAAEKMKKLF